jgi:hypothetical protein
LPTRPLAAEKVQQVRELLAQGLTHDNINKITSVSTGVISRIRRDYPVGTELPRSQSAMAEAEFAAANVAAPEEKPIAEAVRKALSKGLKSMEDLANIADCSPKRITETLAEMRAKGVMLFEANGCWGIKEGIHIEPGFTEVLGKPGTHRFGVCGDQHLCNRHSRLDVLNAAYDYYEREGITTVYNTGNWIDGEARFNKTELITRPGMDAQLDYMIDKYPVRKGITTHYIAGDDHEGWYQQRECIEVGKYLQMRAEDQGRTDLKYLGYGECDVKLSVPGGGSSTLRVVHPGGGSSYAVSYATQKLVESYQGGEKPQAMFVGHYHKYEVGYPREVFVVQTGCMTDQSLFMRKLKLQAHVGFLEVAFEQDETGALTKCSHSWFPFYNRGLYENRF